jgi:hypothetical protein
MDDDARGVDHRIQAGAQCVAETMGGLGYEGFGFRGGFAVQDGLARAIQGCAQRLKGEFTPVLFH